MFEFTITGWLVIVIAIVIVFLIVGNFIAHLKARKKVEEGMLYGGVEYLVNALKDVKIREEAIEALGKTKDPRAVEALISFVNSKEVREEEDAYMLSLGLNALGETEDPKAMDFLIAALSDKDWIVRCCVCNALAQKGIKDFRAVEPLIALLKDTKDMKRRKDSRYKSMDEECPGYILKMITGKDFGDDPEKWEKWWQENKKLSPTADNSG